MLKKDRSPAGANKSETGRVSNSKGAVRAQRFRPVRQGGVPARSAAGKNQVLEDRQSAYGSVGPHYGAWTPSVWVRRCSPLPSSCRLAVGFGFREDFLFCSDQEVV